MPARYLSVICVLAALGACGIPIAMAQEAPHRITAQEVAEALADPSATISYFNLSYRAYMDVGPEEAIPLAGLPAEGTNHELRLNAAGFLRLPGSSLMYRAFLPTYSTHFPVDDSGLGDALISAYWVPTGGDLIVGGGGALIAPTASEDYYGTGKWSAGPTLVVAKKVPGKFTVGGLLTHVWSFAGDEERETISITTIQPAVTCFLNRRGSSISLTSETTYNWQADEDAWQIPVSVGLGQVLPPFGKFFLGIGLGASYYIEKPEFAPEWDLRAVLSIVLPS
jgi:hypothetical protein